MAELDLSGVAALLESWFKDADVLCVRESTLDDGILDPETGDITDPVPELVWEGSAGVLPMQSEGRMPEPVAATTPVDTDTTHKVLLPLSSNADLRVGDLLLVRAVPTISGDPSLIGRWFEFTEKPTTSMLSVARIGWLKPSKGIVLPVGWP